MRGRGQQYTLSQHGHRDFPLSRPPETQDSQGPHKHVSLHALADHSSYSTLSHAATVQPPGWKVPRPSRTHHDPETLTAKCPPRLARENLGEVTQRPVRTLSVEKAALLSRGRSSGPAPGQARPAPGREKGRRGPRRPASVSPPPAGEHGGRLPEHEGRDQRLCRRARGRRPQPRDLAVTAT